MCEEDHPHVFSKIWHLSHSKVIMKNITQPSTSSNVVDCFLKNLMRSAGALAFGTRCVYTLPFCSCV